MGKLDGGQKHLLTLIAKQATPTPDGWAECSSSVYAMMKPKMPVELVEFNDVLQCVKLTKTALNILEAMEWL